MLLSHSLFSHNKKDSTNAYPIIVEKKARLIQEIKDNKVVLEYNVISSRGALDKYKIQHM